MEGTTEAKLEGLSCYGSNVLVLIQAQVVIGDTRGDGEGKRLVSRSKELPTFRIGRKLTHRAHRRLVHIASIEKNITFHFLLKQVKPVTESKQTSLASKSKTTDNEEELKDEKTNKAEHTHKHVINSGENSGQARTGQQNVLARPLKQAMSTNSIAMIESNNERGKNPLNVKRVSSSNDVYGGGSSAVRSRPRMSLSGKRVGGAGKISAGGGVGRRLSADGEGRRESIEGGEGVREEGRKEKTKEHRPSLQSGGIRLPSQRGGRAPPMIQHETVSNKTGLHHPTTGRLHSNIESSPYAVSINRYTRL